MIIDQLKDDMKTAMKSRDAERLETIRYLLSEIKNEEIDAKGAALNEDAVIKLLRTELKRRNDAVSQFKDAGRNDLADEELPKIAIIESYLPALMSEDDIMPIIDETLKAVDGQNFGQIMGAVMAKLKGQADGATVSKLIKQKLST